MVDLLFCLFTILHSSWYFSFKTLLTNTSFEIQNIIKITMNASRDDTALERCETLYFLSVSASGVKSRMISHLMKRVEDTTSLIAMPTHAHARTFCNIILLSQWYLISWFFVVLKDTLKSWGWIRLGRTKSLLIDMSEMF